MAQQLFQLLGHQVRGKDSWPRRYDIHLSNFHLALGLSYKVKGRNFLTGEHCPGVPVRGACLSLLLLCYYYTCCIPGLFPSSLREACFPTHSFLLLQDVASREALVRCQEAQQTLPAVSWQPTSLPLLHQAMLSHLRLLKRWILSPSCL